MLSFYSVAEAHSLIYPWGENFSFLCYQLENIVSLSPARWCFAITQFYIEDGCLKISCKNRCCSDNFQATSETWIIKFLKVCFRYDGFCITKSLWKIWLKLHLIYVIIKIKSCLIMLRFCTQLVSNMRLEINWDRFSFIY